MATTDDKPKKSELFRRLLDFVFGFENRRGEIVDQWLLPADGFSLDPDEFYSAVERKIADRNIPGMTVNREEFAEGGLMSDQRLYLRFLRERFWILACAAPFGKIYFFSCRVIHIPALVRLWHIMATLVFFGITGFLLIKPLGLPFAIVAEVALIFALVGVLRNAGSAAFDDLDRLLLRIPVVSTIYQDWFRVDTFYREDTRSLYISMLPQLIREAAEEICAQKGFKLVQNDQLPPALKELFQPLPPRTEEPK